MNHLEKQLDDHTIKLPTWVGLAYNPYYVKVEIQEKRKRGVECLNQNGLKSEQDKKKERT